MSERLSVISQIQPPVRETVPQEDKIEESIFEYYNVGNEVDFIKKYERLPFEQKKFYLRENVTTFLAEFAGKTEYKTITYILRDDGLYYGDIRALDNFVHTANLEAATSREHAEAHGFNAINEGIMQGAKTATWISPPKIADYGFVFHLVRDDAYDENLQGYKVKEYILRYPEKMNNLQNSVRIGYSMGDEDVYRKSAEDFINHPILHADNSATDRALNSVGISDEKIAQSELFDVVVEEKLSPLISQYIDLIFRLSELPVDSWEYALEELNAKELLTDLFTHAKVLRHIIAEPQNFMRRDVLEITSEMIGRYAQQETTTVEGGGSCPSVRKTKGDIFSPTSVYDLMEKGISFESKLPFELESSNGYLCPKCGTEYPDETNRRPEDRTPICEVEIGRDPKTGESIKCNFKFRC